MRDMIRASEQQALGAMYRARLDINDACQDGRFVDRRNLYRYAASRLRSVARLTGETLDQVIERLKLRPQDARNLRSVLPAPKLPPTAKRVKAPRSPLEKHMDVALALVRGAGLRDLERYRGAAGHLLSIYEETGESFVRLVERMRIPKGKKERLLQAVVTLPRHAKKRKRSYVVD